MIDVKDLPAEVSAFDSAAAKAAEDGEAKGAEMLKSMADGVSGEMKMQSAEKLQLIDTTGGAKKLDMGNGLIIEDKDLNGNY